jgi:hypothetical protein
MVSYQTAILLVLFTEVALVNPEIIFNPTFASHKITT